MNAILEFIKNHLLVDRTATQPLPARQEQSVPEPAPEPVMTEPAAVRQPVVDGTITKSLSELEQARFEAALIEPVQRPIEEHHPSALHRTEKPTVDLLYLTMGHQGQSQVQNYIPLPAGFGMNPLPDQLGWRIELCGLGHGIRALGFDILGDVVIGRGTQVDIDLEPFGASRNGVSRRHAMLRPTSLHLHLIDLNSTNGTYFNSVQLGRAATRAIRHDDVITLGALSCAIKIVTSPLATGRHMG
jgi:hypothetical protein